MDNDFGFSGNDSTEAPENVSEDKSTQLMNLIMPFLNNLLKNPDKDTIVWKDRVNQVNDFIKKLNDVINT